MGEGAEEAAARRTPREESPSETAGTAVGSWAAVWRDAGPAQSVKKKVFFKHTEKEIIKTKEKENII